MPRSLWVGGLSLNSRPLLPSCLESARVVADDLSRSLARLGSVLSSQEPNAACAVGFLTRWNEMIRKTKDKLEWQSDRGTDQAASEKRHKKILD
jgi:hypothetical protein